MIAEIVAAANNLKMVDQIDFGLKWTILPYKRSTMSHMPLVALPTFQYSVIRYIIKEYQSMIFCKEYIPWLFVSFGHFWHTKMSLVNDVINMDFFWKYLKLLDMGAKEFLVVCYRSSFMLTHFASVYLVKSKIIWWGNFHPFLPSTLDKCCNVTHLLD